jgi:hypothetical protein
MTTHSLRLDREEKIQGDHQRLLAKLAWLRGQVAAAALGAAALERELAQLEAELNEHFAHEEQGGFFAEVLSAAPYFDERVANLLQEHKEMRSHFHFLRKTCDWVCGESGTRAGWLAEFAGFHQRFSGHEQAEHDLLHDALLRDMGLGD